jgi:hypothetical protein
MPRLAPEARNAGTRVNPGVTVHHWSCALCPARGTATSRLRATLALEAHNQQHREPS